MRKKVFITGGAKGIGAACANFFASLNYDIILNFHTSKTEANILKKALETKYQTKVLLLQGDITNEEDVTKMFNQIKNTFGQIDILINNAAYAADNSLNEKTKKEFMRVLEVNIFGTFLISKTMYEIMSSNSTLINISSTDSISTYNEYGIDYATSKAGVNILTKVFADIFSNIKVLGIILPWVNTEAIKEMDPFFLEQELKRTGQKNLLEPNIVAEKIYSAIIDTTNKSGDLIHIEVK